MKDEIQVTTYPPDWMARLRCELWLTEYKRNLLVDYRTKDYAAKIADGVVAQFNKRFDPQLTLTPQSETP